MAINNFREDEQTQNVIKSVTIKRLFKHLFGYKKQVVTVLIFMCIIIGVNIINPIFLEIAIDQHIVAGDIGGLLKIAALALALNGLSMILARKRIIIMAHVTNSILVKIRQQLYEHIQKLSFNFFDHRPAGKILARIIGDVNALKDLLSNAVVMLIPDTITLIAVLVVMLVKNYRLAFAALAMFPFLAFGMWLIEVKAHKRWQVEKNKKSNMNAFTYEAFSGIKVVQSFTAEPETSKSFQDLLKDHSQAFIKAIILNDFFWPMVELSWGIGTALVFIFGIQYIASGTITVGVLVAYITYIGLFWQPIMNLSNFYNQMITNLAGAERIFEIMDIEPDIIDQNEAPKMPPIKGAVSFDHVTFSYDGKVIILEDVSFEVEAGQTIALVGPTGAGKTTIINLISRFYDIQEGTIYIDGHDIKQVNIESLRSQMGIMTQDTFLFTGTIKDNIRYGRLNATDDEVVEAAKAVHAHEFIEKLKAGYDTLVNENGSELSVGQRQLICFARTLISRPNILILDEATSSIDTQTERLVQQGIERLLMHQTSFVIAHRLSTIRKADCIMVIDDQGIIEAGSHSALLALRGHYYALHQAQYEWVS